MELIKTLIDKNNTQILPRTKARLVMMENSNSIEEKIIDLIKEKELKKLIDKAIDDRVFAIEFTNIDSLKFSGTYNKTNKIWDGTLYYSTDLDVWNEWYGSEITSNEDKKIYLRGLGNSRICNRVDFRNTFVITGNNVECNGNIENLLDYQVVARGEHPQMADYCYYGMFEGCTSLVKAPKLPATTLANYCYESMFSGCTSLTEAPELPATTLADYCYSFMFSGCTSLIKAPSILPATVLAEACYYGMFEDCISLIKAPELPATTLAEHCYSWMFANCNSLTEAPELPTMELTNRCYDNMFNTCRSLVKAPELPATTLAEYCYSSMFNGCTSLTEAPELPAASLARGCYSGMFIYCTSLTKAPELPATTLASSCYSYMFSDCTLLIEPPELPAITLANDCYRSIFNGCTSLKLSAIQTDEYNIPYRIPTTGTGTTATGALNNMFNGTGGTFTGTPTINTTYYLAS